VRHHQRAGFLAPRNFLFIIRLFFSPGGYAGAIVAARFVLEPQINAHRQPVSAPGARRQAPESRKYRPLAGSPQKRGVCTRVYTTTPKKPNSALRQGGEGAPSPTASRVIGYIGGEGHNCRSIRWCLIRRPREGSSGVPLPHRARLASTRKAWKDRKQARSKYGDQGAEVA